MTEIKRPCIGPCRDMLRLWFLEFEKDGTVYRRYFADRAEARVALKAFKGGNQMSVLQPYGVYDTQDNCWMGTETGPLLYTDETLPGVPAAKMAAIAAAIMTEQTGWAEGRLIARFYDDDATQLRDKVDLEITTMEAIQRIEDRA